MKNIDNSIAVIAIDKETGKRVGEYSSIAIASRKLFIRNSQTIHNHIFGCNNGKYGMKFNSTAAGVTSYKTGKRYLFEQKLD